MRAPAGCEKLPPIPFEIGRRETLSQGKKARHFRLDYFRRKKDGALYGFAWCGPETQGPPGHVHGGVSALVLDEAMGAAVWLRNIPAVAKELRFRYLGMAPTRTRLSVEASVVSVKGKTIHMRCRLFLGRETFVEGEGKFHRLSERAIAQIAKKAGLSPGEVDFQPEAGGQ